MVVALVVGFAVWLVLFLLRKKRPAARRMPVIVTYPRRRPPRTHVPHVLYGYKWSLTRRWCYFGISNEEDARAARHEAKSWWHPYSTGTMHIVGRFPDRQSALDAERRAIGRAVAAGEQLTNTHHNPRPVRRSDVRIAA